MKNLITSLVLLLISITSFSQCSCDKYKSFYSQSGPKESIYLTTELYQDKDSTLYSKYIDHYGRYLIVKYDSNGNPYKHYLNNKYNKHKKVNKAVTKYQQLKM